MNNRPTSSKSKIQRAEVIANEKLCREHYRLTVGVSSMAAARPGQFVDLCPDLDISEPYHWREGPTESSSSAWRSRCQSPFLRRAFSIAGLRRHNGRVEVDVIYRVVGTGTRWLSTLTPNQTLSLLGPLGNGFPIRVDKPVAWLVAGGVGLPPMLWLVEALDRAGKNCVAFCGAQTRDLLALTLDASCPPDATAETGTLCADAFARHDTTTVISTDDGTLGFHGHIGDALRTYHASNPIDAADLVVYCCGPERMMQFVANYCREHEIECNLCMERNMACGIGTCQSCVVEVHSETDPDSWRYGLCCTEGPVFDSRQVQWAGE